MARRLRQQPSSQTLQQVVELAATTVNGAGHAGVTMLRRTGDFESPAYTDDLVLEVDRAQYGLREGPCLEAASEEQVIRVVDTATDPRWPKFGQRAQKLGVRSMLACRLTSERGATGSLNLHSVEPDAFDDVAVETAVIFGAHAAIALSQAALVESLQAAIASRQLIGEATGMLMERYQLTSPQAFEMLVQVSQDRNIKVRDIAAEVVETGFLPPVRARRRRR
jgi:GAF domain-containing protein